MSNEETTQRHPANAVFMLLEDRKFRFDVISPGLQKERQRLGKLVTGKYQVRGFRNISKAPISMLLPVMSDEVNVSADLAHAILKHWFEDNDPLKEKVGAKLQELGYAPETTPFDEDGNARWNTISKEHADQQFDGTFLPDEDSNSVMLMSLLLGWFGNDDIDEEEEETQESAKEEKATAKASAGEKKAPPKKTAATKTESATATPKAKKSADSKTTKK